MNDDKIIREGQMSVADELGCSSLGYDESSSICVSPNAQEKQLQASRDQGRLRTYLRRRADNEKIALFDTNEIDSSLKSCGRCLLRVECTYSLQLNRGLQTPRTP